jgi:release factor glutamine methyltransferase
MTIFEALNWGREQLKQTSSEKRVMQANPMLDAQILLSNCIGKPTAYLFSNAQEELTHSIIEKFIRQIQRRANHEPISQIIQCKEFFGNKFFVNQFVLTPRQETEILIEAVLTNISQNTNIIDVGTGSGAIAITIAKQTGLPVVAIDIDTQALKIASFNAIQNNVEHLISFLHGSILEPYFNKNIKETKDGRMIIAANLPYLTTTQWNDCDPDIKNFEPYHALVGGIDGLEYYDKLFSQIKKNRDRFPNDTQIYLEIDPRQTKVITNLVREYFKTADIEIIKDLSGKDRVVKIYSIST